MPAFYAKTVAEFLSEPITSIIGCMGDAFAQTKIPHLDTPQWEAWRLEIEVLQRCFTALNSEILDSGRWGLLLEFPIPRRQKRVDVVVLARQLILVLEFKGGAADRGSFIQVEDYALDLADFHEGTKNKLVVPVVVAPNCGIRWSAETNTSAVKSPRWCSADELAAATCAWVAEYARDRTIQIDVNDWNHAAYHPVPSIVEAAVAVFAGMDVREIAHAHSEPHNLTKTVDELVATVQAAIQSQTKKICLVTGVPGSGKTLAGLRAVHDTRLRELSGSNATFFSGNGPLVKILREALVRDQHQRSSRPKHAVRREVETSIQNVHVFARTYWEDPQKRAPDERIVVFDEAQRAWNAKRNLRKFKRDVSEPEMVLDILGRHEGWAVLVCLVGGGQEIHDGEAGLSEWGRALIKHNNWEVLASPEALRGGPSVAGSPLFPADVPSSLVIRECPELHLPVSTRSYRAQVVTDWSNAVVQGDAGRACAAVARAEEFPVYLTRELVVAKSWLRRNTRGTARCGLVASSGAGRLRAHGLETSTSFHRGYRYECWFLSDERDIRSSYRLEVVATEFEIQGLELDWVALCWDLDFAWDSVEQRWKTRKLGATRWIGLRGHEQGQFVANSYRVLLTRARQGLVIWVPRGDDHDSTREPKAYDDIADFLLRSGVKSLDH